MTIARPSLRRVVLWMGLPAAVAALAAVVACAGADVAPESADAIESRQDRQDYEDAGEGDQSGWQWRGSRQDCFYVHENQCFSSREKACDAAGCEEALCTHDDSAPANITCPDEGD